MRPVRVGIVLKFRKFDSDFRTRPLDGRKVEVRRAGTEGAPRSVWPPPGDFSGTVVIGSATLLAMVSMKNKLTYEFAFDRGSSPSLDQTA